MLSWALYGLVAGSLSGMTDIPFSAESKNNTFICAEPLHRSIHKYSETSAT